jgi:hypothetical protein
MAKQILRTQKNRGDATAGIKLNICIEIPSRIGYSDDSVRRHPLRGQKRFVRPRLFVMGDKMPLIAQ